MYIYIYVGSTPPPRVLVTILDCFPFLVGNPDKPLFATGILGGNVSLQKESPLPGVHF